MAGPRGPVMMLCAEDLRTVPVTIHEPYAQAHRLLTTAKIVHTGEVVAAALARDFGIARPRLALAALNPHAGEGGALGREEIEVIAPAGAALRAKPEPAMTRCCACTTTRPSYRSRCSTSGEG